MKREREPVTMSWWKHQLNHLNEFDTHFSLYHLLGKMIVHYTMKYHHITTHIPKVIYQQRHEIYDSHDKIH